MVEHYQLKCPIRGVLKTSAKAKDGLKPSEEFFRVEAIKHAISLGYPKDRFKIEPVVKKFGHAGKNSLRADFAVLDVSAATVPSEYIVDRAILLCEVKRENNKAAYVKNTQVKPLLDFSKNDSCVALYWDNLDQRVFWNEHAHGKRVVREGPLAMLPKFGRAIKVKPLTFEDTVPTDVLASVFERIEDLLHADSIDPEKRFNIIQQLLLAKLYDEHSHAAKPSSEPDFQDFRALGVDSKMAINSVNELLSNAATYYQKYLPNKIEPKLYSKLSGQTVLDITEILAPIRVIASKREVIQTFYMKFAKGLYKWDLAQFFTPPMVTEFIVEILNPQFGEHIKDPACGSADFLTAAFHRGRELNPGYASCVWGSDNSPNAVQVAVLNMLLNGDGKTNIKEEDSLENVNNELNQYQIVVCNPPFGVKIKENRREVLRNFDLGHQWARNTSGQYEKKPKLLNGQEKGILFAELCVKQVSPGGRIGIILPNGYLGNRSDRYQVFRDWLLRHCRLAALYAFPRFTFKTSGADVSASIVYLEKRKKPLDRVTSSEDYNFAVHVIENIGLNLGDKKASIRYVRNLDDGSFIIDDDGNRIVDADFPSILLSTRSSKAVEDFPWLSLGAKPAPGSCAGWSRSIRVITEDPDLTMDPKRQCEKVVSLRESLSEEDHVRFCDIVDVIDELKTSDGKRVKVDFKKVYRYVELQNIGFGDFNYVELRGWQLPQRARHFSEYGDFFLGAIWGSVSKWCFVGKNAVGAVVTNGCYRIRIKSDKEEFLPDLVSFLCTEAYAVQMRSFARGSDGLAEVTVADLGQVIVPRINAAARKSLKPFISALVEGAPDLSAKVALLQSNGDLSVPNVALRPSHVVLV